MEGAKGILVSVTGGEDFSLTEYEEIINIITSNADSDALIISGTSIDETMDDKVKVSVIATGFDLEAAITDEEVQEKEEEGEIIKYPDWIRMKEGISRRTGNFLTGRNPSEEDLGIPTILRDSKVSGNNS